MQKADPENDENAIEFKWSGVKEDEEDIALANFIESLLRQTDEEIFQKSNWMITVSYLIKRKIKKIFFEVNFNNKIFNLKYCLMKFATT